jgi:glycosyltransferase involved in cell wall biosynthesis
MSTEHRAPPHPIVINGRFLGQRVTGVQRYGREVLAALDALLAAKPDLHRTWTLALPAGVEAPALQAITPVTVGHRQGHAWEQVDLAAHTRTAALLVNFGFTGPSRLRRQIITVHDGAVVRMPQAYRWHFRLWYGALVHWLGGRVARVMAVSAFSGREAQACFGIAAERITVTTEGWQHLDRIVADDGVLARHGLHGQAFVLAVSSPTPNKNFGAIVQALELLGPQAPRCVVVGGTDPKIFASAGAALPSVQHLGYVSDAELKALYAAATCFVFPSHYEGFGIPPLEAMASGCPVVASTAEAVREVCGEAAAYFDPNRPAELARQLDEVFTDPTRRATLRAAGLARAQHFSWHQAAQHVIDAADQATRGAPRT